MLSLTLLFSKMMVVLSQSIQCLNHQDGMEIVGISTGIEKPEKEDNDELESTVLSFFSFSMAQHEGHYVPVPRPND